MNITFLFNSYFRQAVGEKQIQREFDKNMTVKEALLQIEREFPELEGKIITNGEVSPEISVLKNGQDISGLDGLETILYNDDQIRVFPPIQGG